MRLAGRPTIGQRASTMSWADGQRSREQRGAPDMRRNIDNRLGIWPAGMAASQRRRDRGRRTSVEMAVPVEYEALVEARVRAAADRDRDLSISVDREDAGHTSRSLPSELSFQNV